MTGEWDVFLSYSRSDAGPALLIARALRAAGLRVFWDEAGVAPFQPISQTILRELGRSRVMLAYYSRQYPSRPACQHELTTAFLSGQAEGNVCRRVLVVNPEQRTDHIHPIELRDARHAPLPGNIDEHRALAAAVAAHVRSITSTLTQITVPPAPQWIIGQVGHDSSRFVGRLPQLWELHTALHRYRTPLTSGPGGRVAVVQGMTGIGKTRLVLQYAHLFRAAYPGGICWLHTHSDNPIASLRQQYRENIDALQRHRAGPNTTPHSPAHSEPAFLWVVDNVPPGLPPDELRDLLNPHPAAHTIITSTDRRYTRLGTHIALSGLSHDDACLLLTQYEQPIDDVTDRLVTNLDGHPEALAQCAHASTAQAALAELSSGQGPLAKLAQQVIHGLERDATTDSDLALDILRSTAVLEPAPASIEHLRAAVADMRRLEHSTAARTIATAISVLDDLALLERTAEQSITISPLLGHLIRSFDPNPQRNSDIRARILGTLPVHAARAIEHARARTQLQRTAWTLQIELAHLTALLRQPDHGLRETLSQLYTFVDFIRGLLTDGGPDPNVRPVHSICISLLTHHLRPLLTYWHPELLAHEHTRQTHTSPIAHERIWQRAAELQTSLDRLCHTFTEALHHLSAITSSKFGIRA